LFFIAGANITYSQIDTSKTVIGPDELATQKGGNYFNYADKNKVNIEIILIGGVRAGKYLIPQGTTVFDFLIMSGSLTKYNAEEFKLVRFKSDYPDLKGKEVIKLSFLNLYGEKVDILKGQPNPLLKAGDMIILPEPPVQGESVFYYITQTMYYITTLISFYYLIYNIVNDPRFRVN